MPRRVARCPDHLEAADAVAGLEEDIGLGLELRPGARKLVVDDVLAGVDARVELGHRDLDVAVQQTAELVERADVVAVAVGERNAPDPATGLLRRVDQRLAAARDGRVHEREAVVLAHEKRVHEAQPRELDQIRSELTYAHGRRNLPPVPGERRFETNDACLCCLLGRSDLAPDAPWRDACGVPFDAKELLRCLDSTCTSSAGIPSSPKTWSPVSYRVASQPSTEAPSTSGRKPAPSALACPAGSCTRASTSAPATGLALGMA